jgi:hypothetical protein
VPIGSTFAVIAAAATLSVNLVYHHHRIYNRSRLRRLQIDLLKTSQATPIINYVVGARQNRYSMVVLSLQRRPCDIYLAAAATLSLNLVYHHHRIYKRSRLGRLQINLLKTSQATPMIYYVVGAR